MIWALLLVFASSCQRYNQWQCHNVNQKHSNSTRILYRSSDPTYGIDIEMVKTHDELATYLQVHCGLIPHTDRKVEVTLKTHNKVKIFWAPLHEGNQRIRLSKSFQTALITSLTEGNPITLQFQGYQETIHPKHFEKTLKKLDSPYYRIPIHLPM